MGGFCCSLLRFLAWDASSSSSHTHSPLSPGKDHSCRKISNHTQDCHLGSHSGLSPKKNSFSLRTTNTCSAIYLWRTVPSSASSFSFSFSPQPSFTSSRPRLQLPRRSGRLSTFRSLKLMGSSQIL